ncbi:MAG: hypothetical protein H7329_09940 [Opitutaceae bacterium]|nr:hypothetical protein [Cytophagales bacterium]
MPSNCCAAIPVTFVKPVNPNSVSFNPASKQPVLDVVSTCEYWTIDRTTGASNLSVTLSWLNSSPYNCLGTVLHQITKQPVGILTVQGGSAMEMGLQQEQVQVVLLQQIYCLLNLGRPHKL